MENKEIDFYDKVADYLETISGDDSHLNDENTDFYTRTLNALENISKNPLTAYDAAVAGGYTGTREQFETDMGNSATNATAAAQAKTAAETAAATFETDTTLAVSGKAADAKTTGDGIKKALTEISLEYFLSGNETYYDTAITNALDYLVANGGGILYLPPKSMYIQNTLIIPAKVKIVGSGMGVTILRLANNCNCDVVSIENHSYCGISGLTIKGNRDRTNPASRDKCGLRVGTDGLTSNVAMTNNIIHDISIVDVNGDGLHCASHTYVHNIHDMRISGCAGYGAYIACIDSIFDSFYVTSCDENAIYIKGANNKLSNMKLIGSGRAYVDDITGAGLADVGGVRNCFMNIECQENRGHGFYFKNATDLQLFGMLSDANGMAYSEGQTSEKSGIGYVFDNCQRVNASLMATNYAGSKDDQVMGLSINATCSAFKLLYQKYDVYTNGDFQQADVINGTNIQLL